MAGQGFNTFEQKAASLILVLIVLWGAWLRIYALDYQSLWLDESISALVIEKIAETGAPLLDSGKLYYPGKPHTYVAALFYKLLGKNVFALRLVSVLFGTAMILLAYFSCKIFYKQRLIALIAALLISLDYLEIAWSRQIRFYTEYQFFFSFSFLLFYLFITRATASIRLAILTTLSVVITVLLHMSGIMLIVPFVVIFLLFRKEAQSKILPLAIPITCMAATFYIQYISPTHDIETTSIINTSKIDVGTTLTSLDHFILFFVQNHTLYAVSIFFSFIYAIYSISKVHIILLGTIFISIIGLSVQHVSTMRSLFVLTPLCVYLTAHFLAFAGRMLILGFKKLHFFNVSRLPESKTSKLSHAATVVLTILTLGISGFAADHFVFFPRKNYFLEYDPKFYSLHSRSDLIPPYSINNDKKREELVRDFTPQPDFNGAYSYINKEKRAGDIFLVAFSPIHHWYLPNTESYWLGFLFLDDKRRRTFYRVDENGYKIDAYVGLQTIYTVDELQELLENNHGFIIMDHYSVSTYVSPQIIQLLQKKAHIVYTDQLNENLPWTRVFVGRF